MTAPGGPATFIPASNPSPTSRPAASTTSASREIKGNRFRPSPLAVAIGPLWFWTVLAGSMLAAVWFRGSLGVWSPTMAGVLVGFGLARLAVEVIGWLVTDYRIGSEHAHASVGIIRRISESVPLASIERVTVYQRARERVLGLGSVRIETAAGGGGGVWWLMVNKPNEHAESVRRASAEAKRDASRAEEDAREPSLERLARPLVIGLTGSIAAGKSTAAHIFRELGCMVIDSDADARAALDRPEVKDSLVSWWGQQVLSEDGSIDRKAVGRIVFQNSDERARLERLVHPIVRRTRESLIAEAAQSGARVVVADVPLLFEAGVDAECDATVFVDAPRALREERARARGWDVGELERREAAQWPVQQKRSRADERVENAGSIDALRQSIADVLDRVTRRPRR